MAKQPKKRKPKKKLSPEEYKRKKIKSAHVRTARGIFRNLGFDRVPEIAEKNISFGGQAGEFDDAFLHENVLLLVEYTTSQASDVTGHLKAKKIIFSKVVTDPQGFITFLRKGFELFDTRLGDRFHLDQYVLKILYCSLNEFDEAVKGTVNEPVYFDYPIGVDPVLRTPLGFGF